MVPMGSRGRGMDPGIGTPTDVAHLRASDCQGISAGAAGAYVAAGADSPGIAVLCRDRAGTMGPVELLLAVLLAELRKIREEVWSLVFAM